ncbi:MAG: YjfI family protein [Thiotrichaceae bacterium]|nr:YjfI family protein [Thiotrichaceae bacterium]PCI12004.1 MAG: hypothetical protein COB71_10775 [Thiotrichales bacterium]
MSEKKTSAFYQRQHRQRMRDQGLVKKEVWIVPEHARLLTQFEKQLRQPGLQKLITSQFTNGGSNAMTQPSLWAIVSLHDALQKEALIQSGEATAELVQGVDPSILMTLNEFGDLPVYLTIAGEQIIVESLMWPLADINDVVKFNDEVLRTHKLFPLSTISLDTLPDGNEYYTMFGALSATSLLSNIIFEVETLADNVIKAADAYSPYLNHDTSVLEG